MREYDRAPRAAFELDEYDAPPSEREEPSRWPGKRSALDARTLYRSATRVTGAPGKVSRTSLEATAARSQGERLPAGLQQRLERRLGTDLSPVRVHTGAEAARSAARVDARAYAVGNDIYFGAGSYDPASRAGQRLIAHEVAHTVQQHGASTSEDLEVSSPADAHEQEADAFAESFSADPIAAGDPPAASDDEEPRRVVRPDEAPSLVRPVQLARVSRAIIARDPLPEPGAGSRAPLPGEPGPQPAPKPAGKGQAGGNQKKQEIIRLPDEMLFTGWNESSKPKTLVHKDLTLAKGAASVFGIPLELGVKANLDVTQRFTAFFGPGMLHDIQLIKTDADRADEPLTPISEWWVSDEERLNRIRRRHHTARATATAAGGVGAEITADAGATVHGSLGFDAIEGKVKVGLEGKAGASATGELKGDAGLSIYYDGGLPHFSGTLSGGLHFAWHYSLSPYIEAEIVVQPPKIPIVDELISAVGNWPVVRWFAPSRETLTWRTKWKKKWTPIKHQGGMKLDKLFMLNVNGVAPNPFVETYSTPPYQPMDGVTQKAMEAPPESEEIPKEVADQRDKVVGHEPVVTASARHTVRAKIGAAKKVLELERHWDTNALTRLRKAIDAAKVKQAKEQEAAKAKGGPQLATVDPIVPIPGSSGKKGPVAELEAKEDAVQKRDAEVKSSEKALDTLDEKVTEVRDQAEGGEGRKRGEATDTYTEMAKNADVVANEAIGDGKETPRPGHVELKRPQVGEVDEPGAAPVDTKLAAEAETRRRKAYRAMHDADEKIRDELLWATEHAKAAAANADLKTYWRQVDTRRGDCNVLIHRFDRFLAELDTLQKTVPQLDMQIKGYDILIKDFADLLAELKAMGPRPKGGWDEKYVMLDLAEKVGKLRLKPEYRDARDHFFPDSSYHADVERWKIQKITIATGRPVEPGHWYYAGAKSPTTGTNYWFWASDPYDREYPTIDHHVEPVAKYWNREGRKTDQPSRARYFNGYGNPDYYLRVVPRYLNEELGRKEPDLTDEVTVSFRGSTRSTR